MCMPSTGYMPRKDKRGLQACASGRSVSAAEAMDDDKGKAVSSPAQYWKLTPAHSNGKYIVLARMWKS